MNKPVRIGIVGGGASGAITAIQCWHHLGQRAEILVFDPNSNLGRGKAYTTADTEYILNVPAAKMSIFPDKPDDFLLWLKAQSPKCEESPYWPFSPRIYFGDYVQSHLKSIPASSLKHQKCEVSAIHKADSGYLLQLQDGSEIQVDYLILATGYGNDLPTNLFKQIQKVKHRVLMPEKVESSPLQELKGSVLVIGSGLTAIDIWKRLEKLPEVKFSFLSRHGLLPHCHQLDAPPFSQVPELAGRSPLEIFKILRKLQASQKVSWGVMADQVRFQTPKIWAQWNGKEKSRFLRHLKHHWEVIRHKVPAVMHSKLRAAMNEGRLEVLSGAIQQIEEIGSQVKISYKARNNGEILCLQANWIIIATGSPISQSLTVNEGIPGLLKCPNGFGYICKNTENLWAIGPASKGSFWEITSVPEIREQARDVAKTIFNLNQAQACLPSVLG